MNSTCPFCDPGEIIVENDLAFAIFDRYPVSHGHILVIPTWPWTKFLNLFRKKEKKKDPLWIVRDFHTEWY